GARFPGSPTNTGDPQKDGLLVDVAPVTPGYFRALGMRILEGQEFDASHQDSANARVAIIDDLLEKRYFPKGNAAGQFMTVDGDSLRIIGVAQHVRMYNLQEVGREQIWVPHALSTY